MSYISELQVDDDAVVPVGSSLYGVCNSLASSSNKTVTLSNFDTLVNGVTIHVKFIHGNTATLNSQFLLAVGTATAKRVYNPGGRMNWSAGAVISFTYDSTDQAWIVNDSDGVEAAESINISNTYNANSTDAISGQGVADALTTLGDAAEKDLITNIIETGINANKDSDNIPTTAAITSYVDSKTEGVADAMHYRGVTSSSLSDGLSVRNVVINNATHTAQPGDVVLSNDQHKEYIWVETNATTHDGYWELFGDEGSYALNSSTDNVIGSITFNGGTPTEVTSKNTTVISAVSNSNAARAAEAVVEHGVLKITTGILPTFTSTQIKEIDSITDGTAPTLSSQTKEVIVPYEE